MDRSSRYHPDQLLCDNVDWMELCLDTVLALRRADGPYCGRLPLCNTGMGICFLLQHVGAYGGESPHLQHLHIVNER